MSFIIVELIIILVLLVLIIGLYLLIRYKVRNFLLEYFGTTSLKDAIEKSKIEEEETPKSISSMENMYLSRIETDFPDLNLNELKSDAEKNIRNVLHSIETKDLSDLKNKNDRVYSFVKNRIEDLKDKKVIIDNINFHKTALNKYEKDSGKATITLVSSLEYYYKYDNERGRKIQTRYKTEFIYIIDYLKLPSNIKALGINCPNCGAPVKSLGNKHCDYCGTGIIEVTKKVWIINNIKEY